ncbi:MAG: hypothetical protein ACKPKO_09325, partial [Candidatus Fonsibacter sp.]
DIFICSPVIESSVDITIPTKKIYGVLCSQSISQRAFMQMIARCNKVEHPMTNVMSEQTIQINNNHSCWTFRDIYETNKTSIHNKAFHVERSKLIIGATHDERRKIISVFNTVEWLNKHPSLYLNFLKLLVESKGMIFTIDAEPLAKGEFTSSSDRETDSKMQSLLNAEDLTHEEYEELSKLKKQGKTTTEENARCEKVLLQTVLSIG